MTIPPLRAALTHSATLTGCGSLQMADEQKDAARKAFVAAPDKAGVYVYRNEGKAAPSRWGS
jgi:hypothetical protein